MTDAEQRLWFFLRKRCLSGWRFRRQVPIGPYIVDFACFERRVIIEIDGSQHASAHTYDSRRDRYLSARGFRVLRFWNNEVLENPDGVAQIIRAALPISAE